MKRILAFLLAVLMLAPALAGCVNQNKNPDDNKNGEKSNCLVGNIPVTFPLTETPESMNILATGYEGYEQENVFVWQKYEQMTGVDVNWKTVDKSERGQEVANALASGMKLDLILRCKISTSNLNKYGRSGYILNLAEDGLLKKYAPNCWNYLQSHPDALASIMNPDGSIYSIPQVNSGAELRVNVKLFVNKKWLERVNMSLPTTTEEFRRMLIAFKEQDANGNGDTDDEIPFSCTDWDNTRYAMFGAFGLGNRGANSTVVDADPVTGKARLIYESDAYRKFLIYMNGLYADGLMDRYLFNDDHTDTWNNYIKNDKIGVFAMTNLAWVPTGLADDWIGIDEALTGPDGDKMWTAIRANFHSVGAAVIPSTCTNPGLALRWLDYFWTDEGTLFYHMGVEGETYEKLDDGTYDYLPEIYNEIKADSFDNVIAKYSPYPGGSNLTVEIAPYFMGGEMADIPAKTARALFEYGPDEYWPGFTFTDAENKRLDILRKDLNTYIDSMLRGFITGTEPLSGWEAYIEQLNKFGAEEFSEIHQAAIDRYHALMTALD